MWNLQHRAIQGRGKELSTPARLASSTPITGHLNKVKMNIESSVCTLVEALDKNQGPCNCGLDRDTVAYMYTGSFRVMIRYNLKK